MRHDALMPDSLHDEELIRLRRFVKEWSDRFGFLATENPKDSFESIDEVACKLANVVNALKASK